MTEPYAVSRRLEEVWAWKEAIGAVVADLPPEEAVASILRRADEAVARLASDSVGRDDGAELAKSA